MKRYHDVVFGRGDTYKAVFRLRQRLKKLKRRYARKYNRRNKDEWQLVCRPRKIYSSTTTPLLSG